MVVVHSIYRYLNYGIPYLKTFQCFKEARNVVSEARNVVSEDCTVVFEDWNVVSEGGMLSLKPDKT